FDIRGQGNGICLRLLLDGNDDRLTAHVSGIAAALLGLERNVGDLSQQNRLTSSMIDDGISQIVQLLRPRDIADQEFLCVPVDEAASGVSAKPAQRSLDFFN